MQYTTSRNRSRQEQLTGNFSLPKITFIIAFINRLINLNIKYQVCCLGLTMCKFSKPLLPYIWFIPMLQNHANLRSLVYLCGTLTSFTFSFSKKYHKLLTFLNSLRVFRNKMEHENRVVFMHIQY